jgi:hypothetical protein
MLSGGDPTALAGFLTKKFLSDKGTQAGIARMFAKNAPTEAVTAKFGGKKGLPALIPGRDYGTTIEIPPKFPPTTFEAPAQNISKSVFNPKDKQYYKGATAGQNKTPLQPLSQIKSEIPYTPIIPPTKKKAKALQPKKKDKIVNPKDYKTADEFAKASVLPYITIPTKNLISLTTSFFVVHQNIQMPKLGSGSLMKNLQMG